MKKKLDEKRLEELEARCAALERAVALLGMQKQLDAVLARIASLEAK